MDEALIATHVAELRRGTVVLACLCVLGEPRYGYALLSTLEQAGFEVDANTLYPLLRRLEKQGLLSSEWNTEESRPRKFYVLTEQGSSARAALAQEWSDLDHRVRTALEGTDR
ncbi:PadR family transcriptional regulator [Nocardioides euryhalodurans]|uniref:PadR family transcriptional regulator n=1 Tax=Nocardioides euryhalodurans TaxID=2518370 RepID=A0A4P7GPQ3_9ACTN|nr:PadR family transcriptional regulator [Nocardioides euryhalodurans]QBR93989.1 PadR family transcriptional regulator [Nocardioides euryhalodurans]